MGFAIRSYTDSAAVRPTSPASTGQAARAAANAGPSPAANNVWECPPEVLADRAVKPGTKLAWLWLWNLAGGRSGTVVASSSVLASALGVSDRVARRWFDSLVDSQLVEMIEAGSSGSRLIYVCDPRLAEQVRVAPEDPQRNFIEEDQAAELSTEDTEGAERTEAAVLVREAAPKLAPETVRETAPKTPRPAHGSDGRASRMARIITRITPDRAGAAAAVLAPKPPVKSDIDLDLKSKEVNQDLDLDIGSIEIGEICGEVVSASIGGTAASAGGDSQVQIDLIADRVFRDLGDARLRRSVCRRVASAVENGQLNYGDVQRAIDNAKDAVDGGRCEASWIYFVGAMKRKFHETGIHWTGGRRPK